LNDRDLFPDADQASAAAQNYLVLLVDDQLVPADALRRILETEADIDYHYCNEPLQVTQIARQIQPSVILLAMRPTKGDGLTLLSDLRADPLTKDIPVVMLSAQEEPVGKAKAFGAGANDYLLKWPDKVELLARIRYHCRGLVTLKQRNRAILALRVSQRQLTESNRQLHKIALLDGLTGISNRRFFDEQLNHEWRRCGREQTPVSLVMLNIDHFKQYNDFYGHLTGDECLKAVAGAIAGSLLRPADLVARFSDEAFGLLLPSTDSAGAECVAETVRSAVEALGILHERSITSDFVTVSLGVSTVVPRQGSRVETLLAAVTAALNSAKQAGRNRFETRNRSDE
jgi:two-component system chemotaxis family response regulator WspR